MLEKDSKVSISCVLGRESRGLLPRNPLERQVRSFSRLPEVLPLLWRCLQSEAFARELVELEAVSDEESQELTQEFLVGRRDFEEDNLQTLAGRPTM